MKRQISIFCHFGVVLLIATLCNGQFNFRNQPIGFRNDVQPNVEPLNNVPTTDEVNEVINKVPVLDELLPQGNNFLPEPNVIPPKDEENLPNGNGEPVYPVFVPENNDVSINDIAPSQGDNLGEVLNNDNVKPPKNEELTENNVPSTDDVRPSNVGDDLEDPSLNENLEENLNNGNVEPLINEDSLNNNVPPLNEESPIKPPISDNNLVPEITNRPSANEELNNADVEPPQNNNNFEPPQNNNNLTPDVNIPTMDEEESINFNHDHNNVVPPNVENPTNNVDSENSLTPEKDEINSPNHEYESNPGVTPGNSEIASEEPPVITPQNDNSNHNGHGHGNHNDHGHGEHGDHQRYRCRKRFGYFKINGYCDKYVECKNYRPRQKICPDGMYFNENAHWSEYPCGYPSDVPCRSRNAPLPSHTSYYCPHQYGFFPFESQDIREQCGQYIMCSGGAPNVMKCPESLVFNIRVGRCDWPEQVPGCKGLSEFKCPDEFEAEDYNENDLDVSVVRNYKHEAKCSYFWSCLRGQARMLRCDYGMIFDPNYGRCVVDELGSCNEYSYPDPPKEDNAGD